MHYTRQELDHRWEAAKKLDFLNYKIVHASFLSPGLQANIYLPGIWEVTLFPEPKIFLFDCLELHNRKIIQFQTSKASARNRLYDPDSPDSDFLDWGWFVWSVYYDIKLECNMLKFDYNVKGRDIERKPIIKPGNLSENPKNGFFTRRILDLALFENENSIIGKFYWIKKFLFYFDMKRVLTLPAEGGKACLGR